VPGYVTVNFGISQEFGLMSWNGLTARFDIINAFDEQYENPRRQRSGRRRARNFGARRGFFFGLSKKI